MNEKEILAAFEHAIRNRLKVDLQMNDTIDDKFILFQPYASLLDAFDGLSVIGLIEKHHTSPDMNYIKQPKLSGVKRVENIEGSFCTRPHQMERIKPVCN